MRKVRMAAVLALAACLAGGSICFPQEVQAAKGKKITAVIEKNYLKAPKAEMRVLYEIKQDVKKGKSGIVSFTAPKKGTYIIVTAKLSSLKPASKNKDLGYGLLYLNRDSTAGLIARKFVTEGGKKSKTSKNTKLVLCTPDYYKKWKKAGKSITGKSSPLKQRTATLKLEKDETVYLQMKYTNGRSGGCKYRIFIKQ